MISKTINRMMAPFLAILCLQSMAQSSAVQEKQDAYLKLKTLIELKQYRFHAYTATSMKGRTIQLTSEYFLKLNKDSLLVDLPYYGRAYSADYAGTNMGVQFTSTRFSYNSDTTKKGSWEITIEPKNETKASKIYISVGSGGYCSLRITSNFREAISYYGMITAYDVR